MYIPSLCRMSPGTMGGTQYEHQRLHTRQSIDGRTHLLDTCNTNKYSVLEIAVFKEKCQNATRTNRAPHINPKTE